MSALPPLESKKQFEKTPEGWASRWSVELTAAEKALRDWHKDGEEVVKRFVDARGDTRRDGETRINLFSANIQTLRSLLYGKTPQVDVKRRFADPNDGEARVAAEILERLLNTDIERDDDNYAAALENALDDRLLPGLGIVRCRYVADFRTKTIEPVLEESTGRELAPGYTKDEKTHEDVEIDYFHWRDFRWSPCRTWNEVRWIAFGAQMTRDQLEKRFGKEKADQVPLNEKSKNRADEFDADKANPWARAMVWEIWNKEDRRIYWYVKGHDEILDQKDDILGLYGFWPCPRPMFANATTMKLIPTPDFKLAQDIYNEIDDLSTRITLLERAVAVRGVYDKTHDGVKRLVSELVMNEMVPVDDFMAFKEKGGLNGVVDWFPLEMVVGALDKLREYRGELMQLLYQVTGMSDIMRGEAADKNATATEQAIKAKFASTRVQAFQNEFARFASDTQVIKAEIIAKFFDPQTIFDRSNVQYMFGADQVLAMKAIRLIKSDIAQYRIEVKPEAVAMQDMAAIKEERSAFLLAVAQFMQSTAPLTAQAPWAAPFFLQMLQWAMASFRGGSSIEGVMDQFVIQAQQMAQKAMMTPPPPDPKLQAAQIKAQAEGTKAQAGIVQSVVDAKTHMAKTQMDLQAHQAQTAVDLQKAEVERQGALMDHYLTMRQQEAEMQHDAVANQMDIGATAQKHALDIAAQKAKSKQKPSGGQK